MIRKETFIVDHYFTKDELLTIGDNLGNKVSEVNVLEERKSAQAKRFADIIKGLSVEVDELVGKLKEKKEPRDMECEVLYDFERKIKQVIHPETSEIVKTIEMSFEDLQLQLQLNNLENKAN
jgi:hypothetical protein